MVGICIGEPLFTRAPLAGRGQGEGFIILFDSHPLPPEFTLSAVEGADSPFGMGRKGIGTVARRPLESYLFRVLSNSCVNSAKEIPKARQ